VRILIDRCQGRWRDLLPLLGVPTDALTGNHHPCPLCGGSDRFRCDDKNGSGSWFCNQCGSGYGIHLVRKLNQWSDKQAADAIEAALNIAPEPQSRVKTQAPQADALSRWLALWESMTTISPLNISGRYLVRRAICDMEALTDLRHCDSVFYKDKDDEGSRRFPAMLALVRGPDGEVVNLHRTYLGDNARKADVPQPRKLLSASLPPGSAVRLAPCDGDVLGIAEGIETALSASILFGVPVWAALNAGGLEKWLPPDGVRKVFIFGDNDLMHRGQAAAHLLAHRLCVKNIEWSLHIPEVPGWDWNDVLRSRDGRPGNDQA